MSNEGSRAKDKTVIARGAIETDYATYCYIMPDQTVSEPLIPYKNPLKQLNWRIEIHKGVIYWPQENPGIYGMSVVIRYGCQVKGNVFAREKISLQSGMCEKPRVDVKEYIPGDIKGNIVSLGSFEIKEPTEREKKQFGDWTAPDLENGKYPLVIEGNVICESAKIEAGVYIKGNIIARKDVKIKPGDEYYHFVKIGGSIYTMEGKVELERCFCKTVRSSKDITVNNLVALELPFMMAAEGQINLNKDVYVVDNLLCQSCMESSDFNLRACESFLQEKCTKLERLTQSDLMPYQNGVILTRTWRTFKDTKRYHVIIIEQ